MGFHFPHTGAAFHVQTEIQQMTETHTTPPPQACTCTCMRAHTTALWINSSSTLLLAITAEGHTSAAGLSSRKKKKKPGSYVTSAQSWQRPRNRAARKQGKLGHSLSDCLSPSQTSTFINTCIYRARTHSHSAPCWSRREKKREEKKSSKNSNPSE